MRWLLVAFMLALSGPAAGDEMTEAMTRQTARDWSFLADRVMGGVSEGQARFDEEDGTGFLRLTGDVSTANRGGFVQMRRDIDLPEGAEGLVLRVRGNGERYYVHLRTRGLKMPWQFYQAPFETTPEWREIRIPFSAFAPKGGFQRATLRPETVESIGIAAYGRDHRADMALAGVGVY